MLIASCDPVTPACSQCHVPKFRTGRNRKCCDECWLACLHTQLSEAAIGGGAIASGSKEFRNFRHHRLCLAAAIPCQKRTRMHLWKINKYYHALLPCATTSNSSDAIERYETS